MFVFASKKMLAKVTFVPAHKNKDCKIQVALLTEPVATDDDMAKVCRKTVKTLNKSS